MQILDYSVKTHFYDIVYNIYDNLPLIEKRKEYFKEINKNDIINVSKKIKLNTIFTLEGKDS